jgi:hypothetical protein
MILLILRLKELSEIAVKNSLLHKKFIIFLEQRKEICQIIVRTEEFLKHNDQSEMYVQS